MRRGLFKSVLSIALALGCAMPGLARSGALPPLAPPGAPDPATLGNEVTHLAGDARAAGQTWLDSIQTNAAAGRTNVASRQRTELGTELGNILDGHAPGTHIAWGGLVAAAADLLPVDDLNNVETVEKSALAGGSQPVGPAFALLARKGFKSVVNLRAEDNSEASDVKASGMNAIYIPVVDQTAPTNDQAMQFVQAMSDPKNLPAYVHCHAGIGRTHTFIAIWRISQGVSAADAIAEGNQWGFHMPNQIAFLQQFESYWAAHRPAAATAR